MQVKKGDLVQIIAGKGRKEGPAKVLKVLRDDNRVIVEGRNLVKKHIRPNEALGEQGGIREEEAPVHASNVMVYSEKIKKPVRTAWRYMGAEEKHYATKVEAVASLGDAQTRVRKVRYARKSDEIFE